MPNKRGEPTEKEIQNEIRRYLQIRGWYVIRIQQGMGAHKGLSDLIAVKSGRVVFAEIKTPRGRLSEYQERFREEIAAHGGEYAVLRSVEDAMRLDKYGVSVREV